MKAKDKAKELVERFKYRTIRGTEFETMSISLAKQCALICVDEMLKPNFIGGKRFDRSLLEFMFLREVKQEIEKI